MTGLVAGWLASVLGWVVAKAGLLLGFVGVAVLGGVVAAASAAPLVGAVAAGVDAGAHAVVALPAAVKVPSLTGRTYVYDRRGGLLATFFTQDRVYVPTARIAPVMRQAIVDIEDQRFYQHGAADPRGLLRALVSNSSGGSVQGASTLTQQYVKNILKNAAHTPAEVAAASAPTYTRKIEELRYAVGLEQRLTKAAILEGYLNIAPFGRNVYGVEAASEYYFGTTAAALTLAQAAMLAGEVQAPSLYDPTAGGTHVVQAADRRDVVLAKMWALHHIPTAAYRAAVASPLGIHQTVPRQGCMAAAAAWYCQYVYDILLKDPRLSFLGDSETARGDRVKAGGLSIATALDPGVQHLADAGMASATTPGDTPIAATAVVRPGTGDVLAVSQSKPFGFDPSRNETSYDWAIPTGYGGTPGFQPGSGMKPITMAVALRTGVMFDTRFVSNSNLRYVDYPFRDCAGRPVSTNPAGRFGNEAGRDYGPIAMEQALWESVNSYFIQLESKVGVCAVYRLATAMGLTSARYSTHGYLPAPLTQNATLTIGGSNTSPLQMSEAYATFADHGVYCAPRVITRVVDEVSGRVLFDQAPQCRRVLPRGVADAVAWVLHHNVEGDLDPASTARPARVTDAAGKVIPTGGKTGTNNSFQAVWYNGFNAQFASSMAVAMPTTVDRHGRDTTLKGQHLGGTTIVDATGGVTAGRVWLAVMGPIYRAQATHPDLPARPAATFLGASQPAATQPGTVPDVTGATPAAAEAQITAAGLGWAISPFPLHSPVPAGRVAATNPAAATPVQPGAPVTLYLSTGP